LKRFLSTGDEKLLWTEDEDEDLAVNNARVLKYLIEKKGKENVERRLKFLADNSQEEEDDV